MTASVSLNAQQQAAVDLARRCSKERGLIAVLMGPAGTGKTTTLRAIGQALGAGQFVVAPTGRAAKRAGEASGMEAMTIHRWLYAIVDDDDDSVRFERKPLEDVQCPPSGVLLVDESSMVGRETWNDLYDTASALGLSIFLVGDGFQLPPVVGPDEEPFSVFDMEVDGLVELTEVFRQALESPVLRAATSLRLAGIDEARRIISQDLPRLTEDLADYAAAQRKANVDAVVIAHKNDTRLGLNREIRAKLGIQRDADPQKGEPILIRRNSLETGLFNGEIVPFPGWLDSVDRTEVFKFQGERFGKTVLNGVRCALSPAAIMGASDPRRWVLGALKRDRGVPYVRAQLGYAMTCHSAQGSEWDRVVVVVEPSLQVMPEQERIRWLYTAITRAKTEVLIARPPVVSRRQAA